MPHTAADVKESVFLNALPAYDEQLARPELVAEWNKLFDLRESVMKALELARAEKRIGKSLDAKVKVYAPDEPAYGLLKAFEAELPTIFIVSQVELVKGLAPEGTVIEEGAQIAAVVDAADGEKCDRCWNYTVNGFHDGEDGCLCPRCKAVLGL
jgi:isoleucyl-tRNA synthetase